MLANPQYDNSGRLRHLLTVEGMPPGLANEIFSRAGSFLEPGAGNIAKRPLLGGRLLINAFFEPSTRTRLAFEIAAKALGAEVVNFDAVSSSLAKGEIFADTVQTIIALGADIVVVRHAAAGAARQLASIAPAQVSVINGGDGCHAHPTQALLDAWTVMRGCGRIEGLRIVLVGDILHSRVARSDIHLFSALGAGRIVVCGPASLVPRQFEQLGVEVEHDLDKAVRGADVVIALRPQLERMHGQYFASAGAYLRDYGITKSRMAAAARKALLLHPGPLNRGVEIVSDIADGPQSQILNQVTNGVAIRMAVMSLLAGIDI